MFPGFKIIPSLLIACIIAGVPKSSLAGDPVEINDEELKEYQDSIKNTFDEAFAEIVRSDDAFERLAPIINTNEKNRHLLLQEAIWASNKNLCIQLRKSGAKKVRVTNSYVPFLNSNFSDIASALKTGDLELLKLIASDYTDEEIKMFSGRLTTGIVGNRTFVTLTPEIIDYLASRGGSVKDIMNNDLCSLISDYHSQKYPNEVYEQRIRDWMSRDDFDHGTPPSTDCLMKIMVHFPALYKEVKSVYKIQDETQEEQDAVWLDTLSLHNNPEPIYGLRDGFADALIPERIGVCTNVTLENPLKEIEDASLTELMKAAKRGDLKRAKELLKDCPDKKLTEVIFYHSLGAFCPNCEELPTSQFEIDTVNALENLKKNRCADINAQERDNLKTALYFAVEYGHRDIVELLLQKGANPSTRAKLISERITPKNKNKIRIVTEKAPLILAAERVDYESVRLLLGAGIPNEDIDKANSIVMKGRDLAKTMSVDTEEDKLEKERLIKEYNAVINLIDYYRQRELIAKTFELLNLVNTPSARGAFSPPPPSSRLSR